ncbi:MAG: Sec-independent protein translocase protein TatB [Burkholderiales bacterium]|nr:Sec-independent protein translocase protein TatB [Burkholderiales bacterium]
MLDIGFSELMVIGVVALIVLGPERLPRVARTAGHLLGRFQRYVTEVKADINREIELSELKKIHASVEDAARSIESTVKSEIQQAEQELRSVEAEVNRAGEEISRAHAELTQSVSSMSMPHMGAERQQADAEAAADGALLAAPSGDVDSASCDVDESSPQLELGLGQDSHSAAAEPAKPS